MWANRFGPVMAFSLPGSREDLPESAQAPGRYDAGAVAQLSSCGADRSWQDHAQDLTRRRGTGGSWTVRDDPDGLPLPGVLAQARRDAAGALLS